MFTYFCYYSFKLKYLLDLYIVKQLKIIAPLNLSQINKINKNKIYKQNFNQHASDTLIQATITQYSQSIFLKQKNNWIVQILFVGFFFFSFSIYLFKFCIEYVCIIQYGCYYFHFGNNLFTLAICNNLTGTILFSCWFQSGKVVFYICTKKNIYFPF